MLVGDPAQIGVIEGPGGMLAALAATGHGVELAGVHRFSQAWERDASPALRRGDPDVLTVYQEKDRLHACAGADQVRPGIDRYTPMSPSPEARDANHAHITPDPATDVEERHGLPPVGRSSVTSGERALDVLTMR